MKRNLFVVFALAVGLWSRQPTNAQTATPAQIQLPTTVPQPDVQAVATTEVAPSNITGATPTPTQSGLIFVEAISEVNARSSPEIGDDNQVGVIRPGERYIVLGRYFQWIQFQFELSPTGRAWVFRDLVNIVGNEALIEELDLFAEPTADPRIVAATETQAFVLSQPGGALTVTAQSRIIAFPGVNAPDGEAANSSGSQATVLPTFTFPPNIVAIAPTPEADVNLTTSTEDEGLALSVSEGVPPIVPIVLLGGVGALGLLITAMRR